MLNYLVKNYGDDIEVFQNLDKILYIRRKYNFWGKLTSEFFKDGKLILKTGYEISFFRKILTIDTQSLPIVLELKKKNMKNYILAKINASNMSSESLS